MNNTANILYPAPKQDYKVLVCCSTYNQSKYIEETLNGFVIQQTNFPFVCLVMDDASTDGEQEVIKNWIECECDMSRAETIDTPQFVVIIVPHKSNSSCTFAFYFLKQNLYRTGKKVLYINPWREKCKYEALCEGDDYWTDPMKLQKQLDFLETNQDYSMCFHSAIEHYEHKDIPDRVFSKIKDKDYSGRYLFKNWIVPTASVLYRVSVVKSDLYKKVLNCKYFIYGDTPLFVTCAELGKVRGLSDVMSVYRRNEGGVTQKDYSVEMTLKFFYHQLAFSKLFKGLCYTSQYLAANCIVGLFYHMLRRRNVKCIEITRYFRFINPIVVLYNLFIYPFQSLGFNKK